MGPRHRRTGPTMGPRHHRVCGARDAALCPSVLGRVVPGWTQDTDGRPPLSGGRREEIEAGFGGGCGEVEAKVEVVEGGLVLYTGNACGKSTLPQL